MDKNLIVIGGPTASGKTQLSLDIAGLLDCPIISADSRQIYKEMNIGTAKISLSDMRGIDHYFLNHKSITAEYSAADYEAECIELLQEIFSERNHVVMVGGTGLYIKAVLAGLDEIPDVPLANIHFYEKILNQSGIMPLQEELKESDPVYAAEVDMRNPRRLIRALSVIRSTNRAFSDFRKLSLQPRQFTPYSIALMPDRYRLYQRIDSRVETMMNDGLLDEVKVLYPQRHMRSLQTVGYAELFDYLDDKISLTDAVDKIKQHTRNYAKRQMTWFKNQGSWRYYTDPADPSIISDLRAHLGI